jgi:hypothetical protein
VIFVAKRKVRSASYSLNTTVIVVLIVGVVAGFVGGFLFAKDRYLEKISEISAMNMEKAVTIDSLHEEIQVLGASTEQGE